MNCTKNYESQSPIQKVYLGLTHFLNEKSIYSSVHPIWVFVIFIISMKLTNCTSERVLLTTFAFYSVLLEMINSSIEQTNDRFGCSFDLHTKKAKELAGAVTALSRLPLFSLGFIIIYRNYSQCNSLQACD